MAVYPKIPAFSTDSAGHYNSLQHKLLGLISYFKAYNFHFFWQKHLCLSISIGEELGASNSALKLASQCRKRLLTFGCDIHMGLQVSAPKGY